MSILYNRLSSNSYVYISALVTFLILTAIVFFFPVEFSEYRNTDRLAPIWYLITQTGGFYGACIILFTLLIYLQIYYKRFSKRYFDLYVFIMIVIFTQLFITTFSLYYAKDYFQNPRPSHLYFVEKGFIENSGKEFFNLPFDERRSYLNNKVIDTSENLKEIYPPILKSWIYEAGFSFPSGHSQTSFFIGTIISFVIYRTIDKKRKYYCVIPLLWAILVGMSRVVIGVHFPMDVMAGAFIGMSTGFVIISLKKVNEIFK